MPKKTYSIGLSGDLMSNEKERSEYRRILKEAQREFEEMYRWGQFSYKACQSFVFRIGRVCAKYDRGASAKSKSIYYARKDIRELCTPHSLRDDLKK